MSLENRMSLIRQIKNEAYNLILKESSLETIVANSNRYIALKESSDFEVILRALNSAVEDLDDRVTVIKELLGVLNKNES
jgi:hypothetical protein